MATDAPDWSQPASQDDIASLSAKVDTVITNTNPIDSPLVTGSVTISTTRGTFYAAVGRKLVIAYNPSATVTVWVGDNTISSGQGTPLLPGAFHQWELKDVTLYAIADTGSVAVTLNVSDRT